MQLYRKFGWAFAVALVVAGASPVHAAWCNVFQVCCFNCRTPRTANYVAAAPDTSCNSCPQQTCTTRYVQRCYYQPVTCYQTKTCYEPVTTYRTSYYYEPVTSYRYSCYYDPCTCTSQQVATPVTCYQLRSQCCPVQSWVQRCSQVPVTTYKQSFYYEPVTSCSQSTYSTCDTCGPLAARTGTVEPPVIPNVQEQRSTIQPPAVPEVREGTSRMSNPGFTTPPLSMPRIDGNSFRPLPRDIAPAQPAAPVQPPTVKLDRIVALPAPSSDDGQQQEIRPTFFLADRQGTK